MQYYDSNGSHALRAEPMSGIWGFGWWGLSLESGLNPASYGCIDPVADAQQWAALGCTSSTCGYVHDPSPYWDSSCPGDSDCDGFPDSVPRAPPNARASEAFMGTDPLVACAATPTRYDEPPPNKWPVDFDDNQTANGNDLLTFAPVFGSISPNPPYNARFDLNNDGRINGSDFLVFAPFFGKHCAP